MRNARYILLLFVIIILIFPQSVFAGQAEYIDGEVIYHQDFSEISDISLSGITKGTASSKNSGLVCNNETFAINTYDDGRVYAILPESAWTESFTVEFDFSFTSIAAKNGYIALMLTSTGEEPGNITYITFRANGKIDGFEPLSEELAKAVKSGEKIKVKVPVEKGVLHEIEVYTDGLAEVIERKSILLIGSGNRGFSVRNASVEISEVYIVNGIGYSEKTGYWNENSYVEDDVIIDTGENNLPEGTETAPPTNDNYKTPAAVCAVSFAGAVLSFSSLKKRKLK